MSVFLKQKMLVQKNNQCTNINKILSKGVKVSIVQQKDG